MKNTSTVLILIGFAALLFLFLRRCNKTTTTTTTTVTTIKNVNKPDQVPDVYPQPADIDELIAKGVQLDSLRQVLRIVGERYQHYKRQTLLLQSKLEELEQSNTGNNCQDIIATWRQKANLLRDRNKDLDNLIDTLFVSLSQARKVNHYTFEEKDEYQQRTTDVTAVGYIPPGGYQVSNLRYFIPTTTTEKVSTERTYRHMLSAKVGTWLTSDIASVYGLQYARGRRIGLTADVYYSTQTNRIMPAGGVFFRW